MLLLFYLYCFLVSNLVSLVEGIPLTVKFRQVRKHPFVESERFLISGPFEKPLIGIKILSTWVSLPIMWVDKTRRVSLICKPVSDNDSRNQGGFPREESYFWQAFPIAIDAAVPEGRRGMLPRPQVYLDEINFALPDMHVYQAMGKNDLVCSIIVSFKEEPGNVRREATAAEQNLITHFTPYIEAAIRYDDQRTAEAIQPMPPLTMGSQPSSSGRQ